MKETSYAFCIPAVCWSITASDSFDTGMLTGPTSERPRTSTPSIGMQMSTSRNRSDMRAIRRVCTVSHR